ncbi:MAG TPA: hypothetical protein VKW06_22455 [Candidatus Angelobacter sp.]|nr:hypothetical protein [Candidatus Angelobacter sp.]
MKLSTRFTLGMAAALFFAAMPVLARAQHGHGAAGSNMNNSHGNSADNHSGSTGNKTVSDKLSNNTQLAGKLQSLLPQGTNLQTAAQGFKNLGQFVAAVHVAHNLGIPFDQLKAQMIGPPKESLGKAIHALKPDANSSTEAKTAQKQAKQDINDSKKS